MCLSGSIYRRPVPPAPNFLPLPNIIDLHHSSTITTEHQPPLYSELTFSTPFIRSPQNTYSPSSSTTTACLDPKHSSTSTFSRDDVTSTRAHTRSSGCRVAASTEPSTVKVVGSRHMRSQHCPQSRRARSQVTCRFLRSQMISSSTRRIWSWGFLQAIYQQTSVGPSRTTISSFYAPEEQLLEDEENNRV